MARSTITGGRAAAGGGAAILPLTMTIASRHGAAEVVLERAPVAQPAFLLALTHGAGGGIQAADLLAARDAALDAGGTVARITQPYRLRGTRVPGPAARQDEAWMDVMAALRARCGGPRVPFLQGGRSNGARLACRTARAAGASAVIALAFPLHPPGHPERSRRGELLAASVPVAAVSGGRDPFGCPAPADIDYLAVLPAEGHALAKDPAAVRAAVSSWLRDWLSRSA